MIQKKYVYSTVLRVESGDGNFSWTGASGEMQKDSRFFIASVTKLYITAVMMQLLEEGKIKLQDPIIAFLPEQYRQKLHVYKGKDYTGDIKVQHLISNTSGLPDYFFHKQSSGKTAADEIVEGNDVSWNLDKTLETVKLLQPKFYPGKKGKAAYSDTNYQILGRIIEEVTGDKIALVFKKLIFDVLNLKDTYVYGDLNDETPVPFYYKARKLWLPNYIASIAPEGGIVSTAAETMIFLKAFFKGQFFPKENIEKLKKWNFIYPPPGLFLFGIGLEKIWIPRLFTPFKPLGEILGFWGQTGSFAWYNPDTDLFFCGTTNQINGSGHAAATKAIVKTIKKVKYP
ncbi:MAG: beta-lactamase family protein [Cyclobacteriaceae bacterium]|nr:beta-lactamase family protein [Cyclobacteriaceae bacterium]